MDEAMPTTATAPGNTWVHAARLDPAVLLRPLTDLHLPTRVLRACEQLGVAHVVDLLGVREDDFLAVPGVGARSWQALLVTARRVLQPLAAGDAAAPDEDLAAAFEDPRTRLALARLGCPGRVLLQQADPAVVLALPGMTAERLGAALARVTPPASEPASLWPAEFLARRLADLDLPGDLGGALAHAGAATFGDLLHFDAAKLAAAPGVGEAGVAALRRALFVTLGAGGSLRRGARAPDGGLRRLLRALDPDDRVFLGAALGLGEPVLSRPRLLRRLGIGAEELPAREARCRTAAHARCHTLLARWRRAAARELTAQDGAVHGERLAHGPLHAIGARTEDCGAPLRLLAFLFPGELFLVGDVLATVDADTCRKVMHAVRTQRARLPRPLTDVEADLRAQGLPALPRGLFLHLLQQESHLQVKIDPEVGEVLHRRRATAGDRIEHLLREARGPLTIAELTFAYRERYRRARRARLLDCLWAEPRFLEIGPDLWDLRERHVDQAELIEAEAARLRDTICTVGGRHEVADLIEGGRCSERVLYLLRDRLRRDPALRALGRGAFCARSHRTSTHVEALLRSLRAAAGEVPLERFLANQDEATRRLRTRLLRENRLFVEVAQDRIDALSNYPFNADRMRTLLRTVEMHLEQHDGFDRLAGIRYAVGEAGLAGDFLTDHMLRDLLLRHGRFELLADDLIALKSRGLKAWIQQRAREAIRRAGRGLSAFELQSEIPELAQFAGCLDAVISADPMVQCQDGTRYVVV